MVTNGDIYTVVLIHSNAIQYITTVYSQHGLKIFKASIIINFKIIQYIKNLMFAVHNFVKILMKYLIL